MATGEPDPQVGLPVGIPTGTPAGNLYGPAPVSSLSFAKDAHSKFSSPGPRSDTLAASFSYPAIVKCKQSSQLPLMSAIRSHIIPAVARHGDT